MGLKPLNHQCSCNPFTKVNGNVRTHIQLCCDFIAPDCFGAGCLL